MHRTEVTCSHPDCPEPAAYKVAARWSDGSFSELKSYGFACSDHLAEVFQDAEDRRLDYTLCPGEVIEEIAIYRFEPGNATASCSGCGGWRRTTGFDGQTSLKTWAVCRSSPPRTALPRSARVDSAHSVPGRPCRSATGSGR